MGYLLPAFVVVALLLLFGSLRDQEWVRHVIWLRVPIVAGLLLFLFPIVVAVSGRSVGSMLGNLLVVRPGEYFGVVLLSLPAAWLCGFTGSLIWRLGPVRFAGKAPPAPAGGSGIFERLPPLRPAAWSSVLALPLWLVCALVSITGEETSRSPWLYLLAWIAAIVVVTILLIAALLLRWGLLSILGRLAPQRPRWLRGLSDGYVDERGGLLPGHGLATAVAVLMSVGYAICYIWFHPLSDWRLPPLAYLMGALMLAVAALAGTTFFLDRRRLPLFVLATGWIVFVGLVSDMRHEFTLVTDVATRPGHPASVEEVLRPLLGPDGASDEARAEADKPVLVVVSAAGGGIQAAAWTSIVLTGLEEVFGPDFARSVRFISGTSGGAVGAMYYAASFPHAEGPAEVEQPARRAVRGAAARSSLEATVWGMVFPDLMRLLVPRSPDPRDRAWAVEKTWERCLQWVEESAAAASGDADTPRPSGEACRNSLRGPTPRMSSWSRDVRDGKRPAVVFNSFVVDTAKRLLIGSADVPNARDAERFPDFYTARDRGGALEIPDISVVTAARVSATFPYVTPIANARWERTQDDSLIPSLDYRLADGGYYDNSATLAAIEWMRAVHEDYEHRFRKVIFLEIRAFDAPEKEPPPLSGLMSEFFGPLVGLTNARTTVQEERNARRKCRFLKDVNGTGDCPGPDDEPGCADEAGGFVLHTVVRPEIELDVLSWHLSREEYGQLLAGWCDARDKVVDCLSPYLSRRAPEVQGECAELPRG